MSEGGKMKKVQPKIMTRQINAGPSELETVLSATLAPISASLTSLTETVAALVQAWNRRDVQESSKRSISDGNISSITSEMLGSAVHRLSKNVASLKDQFSAYRQNINRINEKLDSFERLLETLVKRQTKRVADSSAMEILQHFEDYLSNLNKKPKLDVLPSGTAKDSHSNVFMYMSTEDSYPNGSWLGDPDQPQARVRCSIPPNDLVYINAKCTTPEKMALALLDNLFTKETLSVSNISGKSKLGKKQLDPVLIHGIKCHLVHMFDISENLWERIKLNIDSKCRTAWKKRQTAPEPEYEQYPEEYPSNDSEDYRYSAMDNEDDDHCKVMRGQSRDMDAAEENSQLTARVIRTVQARGIEVLSADQILHFQDMPNIHVLERDHILPYIDSDGGEEEDADKEELGHVRGPDVELYSSDTVSFVMEPIADAHTADLTDER